jgi:site-specific recombinase XerC
LDLELQQECKEDFEKNDAYTLFVYSMRSPTTKDTYLRRLRIFFNHIQCMTINEPMKLRCNYFAEKARQDPNWGFIKVIDFLQFQKERVERGEISSATLRNFVKSIKLFCEMTDIDLKWKKITRGLPRTRRYADDRAPTLEEIQKISEYPDRRIKALVFTMASSGIRLSAWEYLQWGHIKPFEQNDEIVAAKVIVYSGDVEEYFTFITSEAYHELEKWMDYRKNAGEEINGKSWVMRWKWDTKKGHNRGLITAPRKLETIGIKRLVNDALWAQNVRNKSQLIGNRYEFQADHGFRKWFKTRCELAGMKSINIEILMGHSIGISDSYYRITEQELLQEYLKAKELLTINSHNVTFNKQIQRIEERNRIKELVTNEQLSQQIQEMNELKQQDKVNMDSIRSLSDQVSILMKEINSLKKSQLT